MVAFIVSAMSGRAPPRSWGAQARGRASTRVLIVAWMVSASACATQQQTGQAMKMGGTAAVVAGAAVTEYASCSDSPDEHYARLSAAQGGCRPNGSRQLGCSHRGRWRGHRFARRSHREGREPQGGLRPHSRSVASTADGTERRAVDGSSGLARTAILTQEARTPERASEDPRTGRHRCERHDGSRSGATSADRASPCRVGPL
jgi:hypothetical protein